MAAGVWFGSLHMGALAGGCVLSLYPNLGISQLGSMTSSSTSAFRTTSDPSDVNKPLFLQDVGPYNMCVTAQGLLWDLAWPVMGRPVTMGWKQVSHLIFTHRL